MRTKTRLLIIANDGWPLEQITGGWINAITNFVRRLKFGKYKQCKACYERETGRRIAGEDNNF